MFIGKYNRSVILTYIGVAFAFAGIALTMSEHIAAAMVCLIAAGICDLFDGAIARRCKRDQTEKEFGVQIDSLADTVGFLALPTVLGLRLMADVGAVGYPIILGYILCGIIRLAWFNTSAAAEGTRTHYDGLPVTYSALIFPILWAVLGFFERAPAAVIWAVFYALAAVMFIFNVKIPKPRGAWYGIFGALAVGVAALIILRDIV
ncbi:MAG: CDP-alcohol phosphatidyltransferase family protein [Oscillospiraceae bacterium]|nr:CDP-alcohol phosphatidyltransferase family protein [Oscillospiraceae bacterium]